MKRKIKRAFEYIYQLVLMMFFKFIGTFVRVFCRDYQDLWLVCERGNDARDNGYWFYRYLREHHPEINSRYVITKDSVDYNKIAELGGVVHHRTFAHYLAYYCADCLIGTHAQPASVDLILFYHLARMGFKARGKQVFLQHGIIQSNIGMLHYPNFKIDLFSCGAVNEYTYIRDTYNHPDGVVKYLGLCRFDNLVKPCEIKREIVLMPTQRGASYPSGGDFCDTLYFKTYNALLNSKSLLALLDEYDFTLVFYPHVDIQKDIECFSTQSDRVVIADKSTYDCQQLLVECSMLITDRSSIHFDIGYLQKPLIYYQFDDEEYYKYHYQKGYFDFDKMGFGAVCHTEYELIAQVESLLKNKLKVNDEFIQRSEKFFPLRDTDNCKRAFCAICELLG